MPLDQYPILSMTNSKSIEKYSQGKHEIQTHESKVFSIEDMQTVTANVNFGLVPSEILVLLSALSVAINNPSAVSEEEFIGLQASLRNEIISGYIKLRGKHKFNRNRYIKKNDDIITFSFKKQVQ